MKPALRAAAIVLLLALLVPALSAACPLCKEAASEADQGGASMWRGMYWSILLMVGAPFAMVGTMIIAVRRARRRLGERS